MMKTLYRGRVPVWPAAALILSAVLLLRGLSAFRTGEDAPDREEEKCVITLYDARAKCVRRLDLEEYICGVVAAEMPASFAPEALAAQAVAARTYAVRRMAAFGGTGCAQHATDVCSDSTCCQAWRSEDELALRWGEDAAYYEDKIAAAVKETQGMIAVYDGEPIEALYHSSSGGTTEAAADVFGARVPYLVSVSSPGEENASHFEDEYEFTAAEFVKKANDAFPKAKLSEKRLRDEIEIISRASGGRVRTLRLGGATLTGRQFRAAFGLQSTAFTISAQGGTVTLITHGSGHGVGMSQYGADAMARDGATYEQILLHYYTGVKLASLYESDSW